MNEKTIRLSAGIRKRLAETAEKYPSEFTSEKAGQESVGIPMKILLLTRFPFLGLYYDLIRMQFHHEYIYFIIADLLLISFCTFFFSLDILGYRLVLMSVVFSIMVHLDAISLSGTRYRE
ncbi:hypothetical protein QA601_17140 [Chitinispirillales bacterium ANBcel5]|uniref:hypothetical protein n=1 Tax=Cellulosispirillum alkaliphilum TaxID=3039283 RepID=UPI002A598194|nr:hypothetical protein [Chitinispirillales bacterium ANBcel5]